MSGNETCTPLIFDLRASTFRPNLQTEAPANINRS
jgi:hypothetical protein